jgi:hypothetical protein
MNLISLYDNAKRVSKSRTNYGQNSNWNLKNVIPFEGTGTLLFQAECHGETVEAVHIVNMQFSGLKILSELPENADYKEIEYKGEIYYIERPTLHTEVTVRCSCPDFYFTFMWYNFKNKTLFGRMGKRYVRKTTTRPERNPLHIPGICKHLFQLQSYLRVHDYLG